MTEIEEGTIAYDLAQMEPVIVTDPDVGTIEEQSEPQRELIENSAANQAIGIHPEMRCLEVMYFDMQSKNTSTYTFPDCRIGAPIVHIGDRDFTPREYMQFKILQDLVSNASQKGTDETQELLGLLAEWDGSQDVLDAIYESVPDDLKPPSA